MTPLICRYCLQPPESCDAEQSGRGGDIVTVEEYERELLRGPIR
jgi:hypothetical protein